MDEDQSNLTATLKAHGRSLQALHDTQQDHTKRLTRIEGRLGNVEGRLGTVEEKVDALQIGVHAILDLLNTHLKLTSRLAVPPDRRHLANDDSLPVGNALPVCARRQIRLRSRIGTSLPMRAKR